ncbi:MAG: GNAT family N-acetyltransferase [Hyphomicrobiales bacterium]|nr:MAG: GNAT family N-acetyltransferase [Hyphomicrobiales bacterium]
MLFRDVSWRAMSGYDLNAVSTIAAKVHPGFFEADEVLAEKHSLYRHGCYILEVAEKPSGYVLSHPWTRGSLPALNALIGVLPEAPDTFYIHDLALLPVTRGVGAAGQIVAALTKHAEAIGFPSVSLVAVNGSVPFWEKQGFVVEDHPDLSEKLAAYEDAARYMVRAL